MRQSNRIKQFSWMVAVVFLLASVVQAAETARLLTSAKVNVYRDGQLVQVLKENAPLPQGALIKPEGDCGVRMAYMSLVAKAGSGFAVRQDGSAVELGVESGTVYFAATSAANKTVFKTPAGLVVVQQMIVKAAADGLLKGFVQVQDGTTSLGVLDGGDMVVSTVEGERVIHAGEQMILAQAAGSAASGGAAAGSAGGTAAGGTAAGAAVAGTAAGAAVAGIPAGLLAAGMVAVTAATVGGISSSSSDDDASPNTP
jgi:hypothetical protein